MSEQNGKGASIFDGVAIVYIDLQLGVKNFTAKIYLDVLRGWCKHIQANLDRLRVLAGGVSGDGEVLKEYIIVSHGLKGSSYGVCADGVGKTAEALEKAARSGDLAYIAANTEPFIAQANLLHERLEQFVAANTEKAGAKPLAKSLDTALLAEILEACKQFKSSSMEEALEKLDAFEYESGGDLVPWLRKQMDNLEYDEIEERLTEVLKG